MGWWPQVWEDNCIDSLTFDAPLADVKVQPGKKWMLDVKGWGRGEYMWKGLFQTLQRSGTDPWIYKLLAWSGSCFWIPFLAEHDPIWGVSEGIASGWYAIAWQAVTACTQWDPGERARLDANPHCKPHDKSIATIQLSPPLKSEHPMK